MWIVLKDIWWEQTYSNPESFMVKTFTNSYSYPALVHSLLSLSLSFIILLFFKSSCEIWEKKFHLTEVQGKIWMMFESYGLNLLVFTQDHDNF